MNHKAHVSMAQFATQLKRLGLGLRMDKNGVMLGRCFGPLFAVEESFPTLWQAYQWTKDISA